MAIVSTPEVLGANCHVLDEAVRLDQVNDHPMVEAPRIDETRAGEILSCVGYETTALMAAAFPHAATNEEDLELDSLGFPTYRTTTAHKDVRITGGQLDAFMHKLQGNEPFWEVSRSYFSSRLDSLARSHPGYVFKYEGDSPESRLQEFELTETGFWIARAWGGWLLKWGYDTNTPLRIALGEAKQGKVIESGDDTVPDEVETFDSILIRLRVLASLLADKSRAKTIDEIRRMNGEPLTSKAIRRHVKSLKDNGIVTQGDQLRGITYCLHQEKKEDIKYLLTIYARMLHPERDFYLDGHRYADAAIQHEETVRCFMKRVALSGERVKQHQTPASQLGDTAIRNILYGTDFWHRPAEPFTKRLETSRQGPPPAVAPLGELATQNGTAAQPTPGLHGLNWILRERED